HLTRLRALRDELLVRCLHFRAEVFLDVEPSLIVRLRPAVVVVRSDVDPCSLERRSLLVRPRRAGGDTDRENRDTGEREHGQDEGELPPSCHRLLSPPGVVREATRL